MSYKITFRDNTSVIVPNETGEKLKASLLIEEKPEYFTLAGDAYRTSLIVSVTYSNLPTAKDQDLNHPALPQPKYNCVAAGTSIQLAIHKIIQQQHPQDWPTFVGNKDYRNKVRVALRTKYPDKGWCDHRANEHACLGYDGKGVRVSTLL